MRPCTRMSPNSSLDAGALLLFVARRVILEDSIHLFQGTCIRLGDIYPGLHKG
jgi:hypothetical protein